MKPKKCSISNFVSYWTIQFAIASECEVKQSADVFRSLFKTITKGQGNGFELSLSYDIVKAHGGEIKVETQENEGSRFAITMPV